MKGSEKCRADVRIAVMVELGPGWVEPPPCRRKALFLEQERPPAFPCGTTVPARENQ